MRAPGGGSHASAAKQERGGEGQAGGPGGASGVPAEDTDPSTGKNRCVTA